MEIKLKTLRKLIQEIQRPPARKAQPIPEFIAAGIELEAVSKEYQQLLEKCNAVSADIENLYAQMNSMMMNAKEHGIENVIRDVVKLAPVRQTISSTIISLERIVRVTVKQAQNLKETIR